MTTWATAFTRFAASLFFLIRAGHASMLAGSEDVVGPLLTRASLRVSVNRDNPLV